MESGCLGGYSAFSATTTCDKFLLRALLERSLGNRRNGLFDYFLRVSVILSLWILYLYCPSNYAGEKLKSNLNWKSN
ncbi:rCG63390 [Rattus norvegicus]|uniref:RCG63390 n=1 Tax=Rattus norvegicus TaxID=10116 RepID=A6JF09_RAT|nr:rCG63390 [Rattus norvegicus]